MSWGDSFFGVGGKAATAYQRRGGGDGGHHFFSLRVFLPMCAPHLRKHMQTPRGRRTHRRTPRSLPKCSLMPPTRSTLPVRVTCHTRDERRPGTVDGRAAFSLSVPFRFLPFYHDPTLPPILPLPHPPLAVSISICHDRSHLFNLFRGDLEGPTMPSTSPVRQVSPHRSSPGLASPGDLRPY